MVKVIIGLNEIAVDEFVVLDSNGAMVLGLVDANFTRELYDPNGNDVSATVIPVITELGGGSYRIVFTPNLAGSWELVIFHNVYFPGGKIDNYLCQVGGTLTAEVITEDILTAQINNYSEEGSVAQAILRGRSTRANIIIESEWTKKEKEKVIIYLKDLIKIIKELKKLLDDNEETNENDLIKEITEKIDILRDEKNINNNKDVLDKIENEINKLSGFIVKLLDDNQLSKIYNEIKNKKTNI